MYSTHTYAVVLLGEGIVLRPLQVVLPPLPMTLGLEAVSAWRVRVSANTNVILQTCSTFYYYKSAYIDVITCNDY